MTVIRKYNTYMIYDKYVKKCIKTKSIIMLSNVAELHFIKIKFVQQLASMYFAIFCDMNTLKKIWPFG